MSSTVRSKRKNNVPPNGANSTLGASTRQADPDHLAYIIGFASFEDLRGTDRGWVLFGVCEVCVWKQCAEGDGARTNTVGTPFGTWL